MMMMYTWQRAAKKKKKKPQHKLENIVQEGITNYRDTRKDCLQVVFFFSLSFFLLKLHSEELFQGIALTFTFTPSFSKAW